MIDAVVSYHTSPFSCGVARFSRELASRIGVPFVQLSEGRHFHHPLISIKWQELVAHQATGPGNWPIQFDLFVHDEPQAGLQIADQMIPRATTVYAANPVIAEHLRQRYHRAVFASFCPPTFTGKGTRSFPLFTFGMAGRVAMKAHAQLRDILDAELKQRWTIGVSCAIHEGHEYERSVTDQERLFREIYGDRLRMLGCLADDAIIHELTSAAFVPLFFEPAARANHTSLWLALSRGAVVITNLDEHSPPELVHGENVFDLKASSGFIYADERRVMRGGAAKVAALYSWNRLVEFIQPTPINA